MSDVEVGKHIQERREALHLTQEELLSKLKQHGLDRKASTLSAWENGHHVPIENLQAIALALEESPLPLYQAAGLLVGVPNIPLILALSRLTQEQQYLVELLTDAVLKAENKT
jgi:transcriptional regulator with XRE-family HTH domain